MSDTPYKLVLFRPTMTQGGADRVTLTLLQQLDRRVFDITLVLVRKEGEWLTDIPVDISLVSLEASSLWTAWYPLMAYLKSHQPDILFSTCSGANMPAALAHWLTGHASRLVLSERNVLIHGKLSFARIIGLFAKRLLYPHADLITSVSEGVKQDLVRKLRLKPESIRVVYNPVVSEDMLEKAKEAPNHQWFEEKIPILLAVSRLVSQKDIPTLLKAVSRVYTSRRIRLIVLGEGSLKASMQDYAWQLGIAQNVWFGGFIKNPFSYMARCDVFVLSSKQEGLPGVLIQAMACGAAVISTDCPSGPNEIVDSGENGFLVAVGDDQSLADRINFLLDHPEVRERFANKAPKTLNKFTVAEAMARYEAAILGTDDAIVEDAKSAKSLNSVR